jgi:hypothetical protein
LAGSHFEKAIGADAKEPLGNGYHDVLYTFPASLRNLRSSCIHVLTPRWVRISCGCLHPTPLLLRECKISLRASNVNCSQLTRDDEAKRQDRRDYVESKILRRQTMT